MDAITAGIIAEVVSAAVTKAAGWSASNVGRLSRRRGRRKVAETQVRLTSAVLSDDQVGRLGQYLQSGEFLLAASLYARAYLAADDSTYAEQLFEMANRSIDDSISYWLAEAAKGDLALNIRGALLEQVTLAVDTVGRTTGFSPTIEAELAKTAAAIVASNVVDTLGRLGLQERLAFIDFAQKYRRLVALKYANMSLPHAGITRRVPYNALFVEPQIEFASSQFGAPVEVNETLGASTVAEAMRRSPRAVILGNPGGGKSTLSQKLVFDISAAEHPDQPDVPFLIVLREYAAHLDGRGRMSLAEYIEYICSSPLELTPPPGAIEYLLSTGRALVVFDGLDELLDTSLRRRVVEAVEGFTNRYPLTSVLVTSRKVGYEDAALDPILFPLAVLGNFSPDQVEKYAANWFSLDESVEKAQQLGLTESFMEDSRFVNDLRVNPLMLALMCGIYASERYIPKNRPDVYEKCANLLLDQWDRQRGIEMALPFDALVQRAMRVLALHMYRNPEGQSGIARSKLVDFMTDYLLAKRFKYREDAEDAANQFLDFCKGRAWVLSEVGADLYSFTHRTFLEYFAASQLVKEFTNAPALYEELRRDISSGNATVVHHLAIQILGKSTEDGAEDFFGLVLKAIEGEGESGHGANECHFLVGSLAFLVVHPTLVEQLMERVVALFLEADWEPADASLRSRLMRVMWELGGIASENAPTVQESLERLLLTSEASLDKRTRALSIAANLEIASHDSAYGQHAFNQPWLDWAEGLRAKALVLARLMVSESRWAATELVLEGTLTLGEMVRLHGAKSMFLNDPEVSFLVNQLPVALAYLANFGRTLEQKALSDEELLELVDILVTGNNAQLDVSADTLATWGPTVLGATMESNRRRWPLILPIVEALGRGSNLTDVYSSTRRRAKIAPWMNELIAMRTSALAIADDDVLAFLGSGAKEAELISAWISGRVNFFGETPPESSDATVAFAS